MSGMDTSTSEMCARASSSYSRNHTHPYLATLITEVFDGSFNPDRHKFLPHPLHLLIFRPLSFTFEGTWAHFRGNLGRLSSASSIVVARRSLFDTLYGTITPCCLRFSHDGIYRPYRIEGVIARWSAHCISRLWRRVDVPRCSGCRRTGFSMRGKG
jgi:hypothetical protein